MFVVALAASSLTVSSCSDWLNVKPSNQTEASVIFSSEKGFQEVMAGVHILMSSPNLYGRELTFGMTDVIGGMWANFSNQQAKYYTLQAYDYEKVTSTTLIDSVWMRQYNAIAQINNMLDYVDVNSNVFATTANHAMIKGESLALRAFLHFDILRLFAPYKTAANSAEKWLPYVDQYVRNTSESVTLDTYVTKLNQDIDAALDLLKADDIVTGKVNGDLYYKNRMLHFNYYAVKALQARVALYIDDKPKALAAAQEVITAHKGGLFPFVTDKNATTSDVAHRDRTFSTEHIFALNIRKMKANTEKLFHNVEGHNILLTRESVAVLYEGIPEYRSQFFETESGKANVPSKFWELEATNTKLPQFKERMPIIRISEMYYIAAESTTDLGAATEYLNTVRRGRGITEDLPIQTSVTLPLEIMKEYKKEFVGEGQLFYYYKRFNVEKIGGKTVKYVLPMPSVEIDFGNRPNISGK